VQSLTYLLLPATEWHADLSPGGSAPQRCRNHTEDGSKTGLSGYGEDPWEMELTPAFLKFFAGFTSN